MISVISDFKVNKTKRMLYIKLIVHEESPIAGCTKRKPTCHYKIYASDKT